MDNTNLIKAFYYNPKYGFVSAKRLRNVLIEAGHDIPLKEIETFIRNQKVSQVFKPVPEHKWITIVAKYPRDIYQLDLLDVHQYAKWNKGYNWILNIVDVHSRYAMSVPIKTKEIDSVLPAFKYVCDELGKPSNLTTDLEASIMSKEFQDYLNEKDITHYPIDPHKKRNNSIVERFNRTLREKIRSVLYANNSNTWLEYISDILENYNNSIHTTTKNKPIDIWLMNEANEQVINTKKQNIFSVGDKVRYLINTLNIFEKKSMADRYTKTTFTVIGKEKNRYIIEGENGNLVKKLPDELQLINKVETHKQEPDKADKQYKKEQKERKINRKLLQEGIDAANVVAPRRQLRNRRV